MANNPQGFMPRSKLEQLVSGLKDYEPPTEVRVYSVRTGQLLRIEKPKEFTLRGRNKHKSQTI